MFVFFVMFIGFVIFVLICENVMVGVEFYIVFEFLKIIVEVVNGVLLQVFFFLLLGMGIFIIYGSYIDKCVDVLSVVKLVVLIDMVVVFIVGLMIFFVIFFFNLDINFDDLSELLVGMIFIYLFSIFLVL